MKGDILVAHQTYLWYLYIGIQIETLEYYLASDHYSKYSQVTGHGTTSLQFQVSPLK